ncbi:MAG: hypothetical protein EHM55_23880 [Acidobacteria bacterium]|nr:MAG: hypothetical protein EHM55_23880 [Acidobacteriota bacterium]
MPECVHAHHDFRFVVLSIGLSIMASYAARDLAARMRASRTQQLWAMWFAAATIVDGLGTWSMQYTAMLGLELPTPLLFDRRGVIVSLLVGMAGSAITLIFIRRGRITVHRRMGAGLALGGINISGLHYTAMASLWMPFVQDYLIPVVFLSVAVATSISCLAFRISADATEGKRVHWAGVHGASIVRGIANPAMYYTAMTGVVFSMGAAPRDVSHLVSIQSIGLLGVSVVPAAVLVVALLTSLVERVQRRRGDQLSALAGQLQSAREQERARLAREIHDELGSTLTGLKWELESLGDRRLNGAVRRVESIMATVKQISSDLRPGILDDLGLLDAIQWEASQFERRTGIVCQYHLPGTRVELSNEAATAAFRIFQEALTNVLRHAAATRVDVRASVDGGQLLLEISDNGRGISRSDLVSPQSLGLLGMRERAALVDGTVDITSQPGRGTTLAVTIPTSTKVAA